MVSPNDGPAGDDRDPLNSDSEFVDLPIRPETEAFVRVLEGLGSPRNTPMEKLLDSCELWRRREAGAKGKIVDLLAAEEEEGRAIDWPPALKTLVEEFLGYLEALQQELPVGHPIRPARGPICLGQYRIEKADGKEINLVLFEVINGEGEKLSYDGESFEVCRGGPALIQIWHTDEDYDQQLHVRDPREDDGEERSIPDAITTPFTFLSPGAAAERVEALVNPYDMNVRATYQEEESCHLIKELNLATEIFLGDAGQDFEGIEIETITMSEKQDPDSPYSCLLSFTIPQGEFSVALSLGEDGLWMIDFAQDGSSS